MEDNKLNTQGTNTSDVSKKEVNDGKYTQEDLDKLAGKVRAEEQAKTKGLISEAVNNAIAEYERKAKMSEDERVKEENTEREKKFSEREKDLTLRENKLKAQELLASKGIPTDLVDLVVNVDENTMKDNIEKLAKTYNKAVENGVNDKLKGQAPTDFSNNKQQKAKPDFSKGVAF